MTDSIKEELDRLYALPPSEFTAARQALAKAYRDAGDREAAEEVKQARKPTLAAWTVNQLARREREKVRSLLDAGERLRAAQQKTLRGRSSSDDLRQASDAERDALRELLKAAESLLGSSGELPSQATLQQVERTLHAAAREESAAELLRSGRLTRELDPTGFGSFTAADLPAPGAGGRHAGGARQERARSRKDERAAELRSRVGELREALQSAERELADAERSLSTRRRAAETARKQLARAESQLERLRDAGRRS